MRGKLSSTQGLKASTTGFDLPWRGTPRLGPAAADLGLHHSRHGLAQLQANLGILFDDMIKAPLGISTSGRWPLAEDVCRGDAGPLTSPGKNNFSIW
jgi:hypothetical protein